jgi:ribonuclease HI
VIDLENQIWNIDCHWVKGHGGNHGNEGGCDWQGKREIQENTVKHREQVIK